MAISRKGKRNITVDSNKYLWWVFSEFEGIYFYGNQIKIVPENQIGYFQYGLEQDSEGRCLLISLKNGKQEIHMKCPKFEDVDGIIRPSGIEKLIKWALKNPKDENRIFVYRHSHETEITPNEDRIKMLEIILSEFQQV